MTSFADQMWEAVGHDADGEAADQRLALARVRAATVWPFLAAAKDQAEYDARLALVGERVEAAAFSVSDGDVELLRQVSAGLREDWVRHVAGRRAVAEADSDPTNDDEAVYQDDDGDWRVRGSDEHYDTRQDAMAAAEAPSEGGSDGEDEGEGLKLEDDDRLPSWIKGGSAVAARLRLAAAARARAALPQRVAYDPYEDREDPVDDRMYQAAAAVGAEHAAAGMPRTYDYPDDPSWVSGYDDAYDQAAQEAERDRSTDAGYRQASLRTAGCRKCAAHGRAADGSACEYCDGRGRLDAALAVVKDADGWRQGLVREGVFHPEEFGSARYEDVPTPKKPGWINDPWLDAQDEGKAFVPGPNPMENHADGSELRPTKSITEQRPGRTSTRKEASPYDDNPYAPTNNPYGVTGPGMPGAGGPPPAEPGPTLPGPYVPGGEQVMPSPVDDPTPEPVTRDQEGRRAAVLRARRAFVSHPVTALVDRMAAEVLSTNPGLTAGQARDLAEESVRRSAGGVRG